MSQLKYFLCKTLIFVYFLRSTCYFISDLSFPYHLILGNGMISNLIFSPDISSALVFQYQKQNLLNYCCD